MLVVLYGVCAFVCVQLFVCDWLIVIVRVVVLLCEFARLIVLSGACLFVCLIVCVVCFLCGWFDSV